MDHHEIHSFHIRFILFLTLLGLLVLRTRVQAYSIAVREGRKHWTVFRRYNQFYELDAKVRAPSSDERDRCAPGQTVLVSPRA